MTKKISAKHPIWDILNRYQQKMLLGVKTKAEQDATAEMIATGNARPQDVAEKAEEIGKKIASLRGLQTALENPTTKILDSYAVNRINETTADKIKELRAIKPAVEVLTKDERDVIKARYADWAKAEGERICNLFDAVQIKISLDDAVDEVVKVLAEAGIKLPDISQVKTLPLALDETLPVPGDTNVTVNNRHEVYADR